MQGKIKLNLQGKETARNGICKEWNLQVKVTRLMYVNECSKMIN